jgi:hypothetical protein
LPCLAYACACVHECAGTNKGACDAHQRQDRSGGRNGGGDAASGRTDMEGQRKVGERVACAEESAATPARDSFPAWHEGRHHQRRARRRVATASTQSSARDHDSRVGRHRRYGVRCSPRWPWADMQALVKEGGAAALGVEGDGAADRGS